MERMAELNKAFSFFSFGNVKEDLAVSNIEYLIEVLHLHEVTRNVLLILFKDYVQ